MRREFFLITSGSQRVKHNYSEVSVPVKEFMNCVISKKSLILFAHCCFRDDMSHVNGVLKLTDGFFSLFVL